MLGTWFSSTSRFMPLSRVANWWRQLCVLIRTACQCLDALSLLYVKRDDDAVDEDVCMWWWWWLAFCTENGSEWTKNGRQSSCGVYRRGRKGLESFIFTRASLERRKWRKRFSYLFLYEEEVYIYQRLCFALSFRIVYEFKQSPDVS